MKRTRGSFLPQQAIVMVMAASFQWTGCSDGPRAEIGRLLDVRAQSLAERNLSGYLSCISTSYNDGGRDYEFVRRSVSGYFSALDGIDVRFAKRRIYPHNGRATVYQDIVMKVNAEGKELKVFRGRERLLLARERDGWKIVGGLFGSPPKAGEWRDVSAGGEQETKGGAHDSRR